MDREGIEFTAVPLLTGSNGYVYNVPVCQVDHALGPDVENVLESFLRHGLKMFDLIERG